MEYKQFVKDYFSFTRSERKALTILCVVLALAVIFDLLSGRIRSGKPVNVAEYSEIIKKLEGQDNEEPDQSLQLFHFNPNTIQAESLDSLDIPVKIKDNLLKYRSKGGKFRNPGDFRKLYGMTDSLFAGILPWLDLPAGNKKVANTAGEPEPEKRFIFDPNFATETELQQLGFNRYQIRNILGYRHKGGKFRRKEDMMKVYGVDSAFYNEIASWIDVKEEASQFNVEVNREEIRPEVMELNSADSVSLTTLPGIGPTYAGRIVRYRQVLGGFYDPLQLLEVFGMTEENYRKFAAYLTVDTLLIKQLRINFADIKTMNRHPYISYDQARQIVDLRSKKGPFVNSGYLLENHIFDKESFRKVSYYMSCR